MTWKQVFGALEASLLVCGNQLTRFWEVVELENRIGGMPTGSPFGLTTITRPPGLAQYFAPLDGLLDR